jgi:hypothetical protein
LPGVVSQAELYSGAVVDAPMQCHFIAAIPAMMTIVAVRNASASLASCANSLRRPSMCVGRVDLVELERPYGSFSR